MLCLVRVSREVRLQTRWKERDGKATIVEASHLAEPEAPAAAAPEEGTE